MLADIVLKKRPLAQIRSGCRVRRRAALSLLALFWLATGAPLAAQTPASTPTGDVLGVGNFVHVVADLDRSLAFYRDVLGLTVAPAPPFAPEGAVPKLDAIVGGKSRSVALDVPGLELGVQLIEFQGVKRNLQRPRFYDPGAANLALRMRDIDAVFERIVRFPGARVITAGGKPVTMTTPRGVTHIVFVQDPDGFVLELSQVTSPPADAPKGNIIGGAFEPSVVDNAESVQFYNALLGFRFPPGGEWNDSPQMAATAGAPGASFRQSRTTIPGTSDAMTLIQFKNIAGRRLTGRMQDPGTTVLQLLVRDVTALTARLKANGVPVLTTGGAPVEIVPGFKISLVRDPNNVLLELVERASR